jgi:IS5 family transposase
MAQRRIGQEQLALRSSEQMRRSSLDEIDALIDWAPISQALSGVYSAAKGEPAWPPLALFKALLIAVWHDLSDVKLAGALDDRGSFRRFCGFSRDEPTPERTAFVRFRRELIARGLDRVLFDKVNAALKARGASVKTGTIVDATVIRSASHDDADAKWSGHRSRRAIHGYKAHVAADFRRHLPQGGEGSGLGAASMQFRRHEPASCGDRRSRRAWRSRRSAG